MLVVSMVKKMWLSNNTFYLQMCLAIAQKKRILVHYLY